jgi:hypothetical protein
MSYDRHDRAMDRYITGNWGEDQFRDDYPEEEDIAPPDDTLCLNEDCDQPNCPEHGDDISAALAAENEGMAVPDED